MRPSESVTRVTRTLNAVTSQIFRCCGFQHTTADADKLGFHDLLCWSVFGGLLGLWFFGLLIPQQLRLSHLRERQVELHAGVVERKRELARLEAGIQQLTNGDPQAWERVARERLGWLEPGEVIDLGAWLRNRPRLTPAVPVTAPSLPARPVVQAQLPPAPRIPTIPSPPQVSYRAETAPQRLDGHQPGTAAPGFRLNP